MRALHLGGGLVGERDREDLVRLHVALQDEVGDAMGEHARLARAGAGQNEQRSLEVRDRGALRLVEPLEQGVTAHIRVPRR